jgi:leucyl-tRNA synthetase
MEHATRHLLYARFWNQFLYNIGLVPNKEPFKIRTAHGMILGEDGEKVSKSKGTGANPVDVINEYSADTLRMFEMFIGDYEKDAVWNNDGLKGCKRFIERVTRLQEKLNDKSEYTNNILVNKTIKKVSEDLENMKFNTAVSSLMIMCNEYESFESITKKDYKILLLLLHPIAPHITEELNEANNLGEMLCTSNWPTYDESMIEEENITIGVQVNGKLRGSININSNMSEEEIKILAINEKNVKKHIKGMQIVKFIIVPKRIVNIIVK